MFLPQYKLLKYALFAFAYLTCVIAVGTAVVDSYQASIKNQYCMVASFFLGLLGSIFLSNIIRIAFNSYFVKRVYNNNKSLFRFLISEEALKIYRDI